MRKLQYIFMTLAVLCMASPAFAQEAATPLGAAAGWVPIGAGIGMAIASGLCGLGQGRVAGSAAEAIARNPGARAGIQLVLVLGLAFIESLALFTLLIIFAKVK
ncbi:MAG TPA: ATP synthase F0 subunit C [Alloacidobacterium sp.]|jgi:F-type H+-transporting ATPase subunit c|nr:ATP synthase F0 subunit C [Alloacidobacterium sp.]